MQFPLINQRTHQLDADHGGLVEVGAANEFDDTRDFATELFDHHQHLFGAKSNAQQQYKTVNPKAKK